jgi:hypothetical protein
MKGGENWSEGNTNEEFCICGVTSGKYKISFIQIWNLNSQINSRLKIRRLWDEKSDN